MDENIFIIERKNDTIVVKNKKGERITPQQFVQIVKALTEMVNFD
jgi:hypothetical protein